MRYQGEGGKGSNEASTCLEKWLRLLPEETEMVHSPVFRHGRRTEP